MSETPRNEENPEFRDPTAPSEPEPSEVHPPGESSGADETTAIDTSHTQAVPPPPPPPLAPPASPLAAPGEPQGNPYASPQPGAVPPGPPPQNPYGVPPAQAGPLAAGPPPTGAQAGPPSPYAGPGYGQPGYGAPGYGPPAFGAPGYAPPGYAPPRSLSGNTIALLIVSGLTTLGCGFGIVALIFAILAATHKDEPPASAKYTRWGWIALVAGFVLAVAVLIIALIAFGLSATSTNYNSGA